MENASKALIIAGSILISIIVISLGVFIFSRMKGTTERQTDLSTEKIGAFNSKITPYLGKNIRGSDVNALIQLVRTIDQEALNSGDTVKRVTIKNSSGIVIAGISGNKVEYTPVQSTGFYETKGVYDQNGLITQITVTP